MNIISYLSSPKYAVSNANTILRTSMFCLLFMSGLWQQSDVNQQQKSNIKSKYNALSKITPDTERIHDDTDDEHKSESDFSTSDDEKWDQDLSSSEDNTLTMHNSKNIKPRYNFNQLSYIDQYAIKFLFLIKDTFWPKTNDSKKTKKHIMKQWITDPDASFSSQNAQTIGPHKHFYNVLSRKNSVSPKMKRFGSFELMKQKTQNKIIKNINPPGSIAGSLLKLSKICLFIGLLKHLHRNVIVNLFISKKRGSMKLKTKINAIVIILRKLLEICGILRMQYLMSVYLFRNYTNFNMFQVWDYFSQSILGGNRRKQSMVTTLALPIIWCFEILFMMFEAVSMNHSQYKWIDHYIITRDSRDILLSFIRKPYMYIPLSIGLCCLYPSFKYSLLSYWCVVDGYRPMALFSIITIVSNYQLLINIYNEFIEEFEELNHQQRYNKYFKQLSCRAYTSTNCCKDLVITLFEYRAFMVLLDFIKYVTTDTKTAESWNTQYYFFRHLPGILMSIFVNLKMMQFQHCHKKFLNKLHQLKVGYEARMLSSVTPSEKDTEQLTQIKQWINVMKEIQETNVSGKCGNEAIPKVLNLSRRLWILMAFQFVSVIRKKYLVSVTKQFVEIAKGSKDKV